MPTSTEVFKDVIYNHIRYTTSFIPDCKILDVGAGYGNFGRNLQNLNVDAIEIFDPYIEEYGLREIYKNVQQKYLPYIQLVICTILVKSSRWGIKCDNPTSFM